MFSAILTLCLYSANDVTSKCCYTSVISFLSHGFITLLRRVLCDKSQYVNHNMNIIWDSSFNVPSNNFAVGRTSIGFISGGFFLNQK